MAGELLNVSLDERSHLAVTAIFAAATAGSSSRAND